MNNTERTFVNNSLIICALFIGLIFSVCNSALARNAKEEMITVAEIEYLMKRGSVESILKEEYDSGLVQKVEYDRRKQKTNFNELVYQGNLSREYKKPVLVFFYCTQIDNIKHDEREALIFKMIANKYNKLIQLVSFDVSIEPTFSGNPKNGIFGTQVKNEGIKGIPSLAIYSQFDLAKSDNNNQRIIQIDILRGGPGNNEVFNEWVKFVRDEWIPTNLTSPNNTYVWRFHNSADEKKVVYN